MRGSLSSGCLLRSTFLVVPLVLLAGNRTAAQPNAVDSVLVMSHDPSGAVSAIPPVLESDVEMVALLNLAVIHGPAWTEQPPNASMRKKSFRTVLITRMLAWEARNMGDEVDLEKRGRLVTFFQEAAGGKQGLQELLTRSGTSQTDLDTWAGEIQLAREQIRYQQERIEMPSDEDARALYESGDHPFGKAGFEELCANLKAYILNRRFLVEIRTWIWDLAATHNLRAVE